MAEPPFYVGYLPAPPAHARAARWSAAGGVLALVLVSISLAASQSDPGRGVWRTEAPTTLTGTLRIDPYPRLVIDDVRSTHREVLLVDQGKVGADLRARAFAGRRVDVAGALIQWGDRAVLELTGASTDFADAGPGATADAGVESQREPVSLTGEIVDPKCYLGVMNPGRGKPHLSCAALCIKGGIPPVLVVRSADAEPSDPGACYLLTTGDGGAARDLVHAHIGVAVRVTGRVSVGDGWPRLAVDSIERR